MKKLFTIRSRGEGYTADVILHDDGSRSFIGDLDVDIDGSPHWRIDPDGQADTTLHFNGKPIDSSKVPGIVLPPECINEPKEIVMGCQAFVEYKGTKVPCVVFDSGPHYKLGEGSEELAHRLKVNASPTRGGIDEQEVHYSYYPGVPAVVDGVTYKLQPA